MRKTTWDVLRSVVLLFRLRNSWWLSSLSCTIWMNEIQGRKARRRQERFLCGRTLEEKYPFIDPALWKSFGRTAGNSCLLGRESDPAPRKISAALPTPANAEIGGFLNRTWFWSPTINGERVRWAPPNFPCCPHTSSHTLEKAMNGCDFSTVLLLSRARTRQNTSTKL